MDPQMTSVDAVTAMGAQENDLIDVGTDLIWGATTYKSIGSSRQSNRISHMLAFNVKLER
jgi:hypothetical protein